MKRGSGKRSYDPVGTILLAAGAAEEVVWNQEVHGPRGWHSGFKVFSLPIPVAPFGRPSSGEAKRCPTENDNQHHPQTISATVNMRIPNPDQRSLSLTGFGSTHHVFVKTCKDGRERLFWGNGSLATPTTTFVTALQRLHPQLVGRPFGGP